MKIKINENYIKCVCNKIRRSSTCKYIDERIESTQTLEK